MPYKSKAQEKFFNANRAKLERRGVNVDEWNAASKGKRLPEHEDHKMKSDEINQHHRMAMGEKIEAGEGVESFGVAQHNHTNRTNPEAGTIERKKHMQDGKRGIKTPKGFHPAPDHGPFHYGD